MSLHVAGSEWDGRSAFGKLMRRVFDSTRRTLELGNADYYLQVGSADRDSDFRQFGKLTLECDDEVLGRSEFEAMCSAMVVAQTTKALTLLLEVDPVDQGVSGHWWKWLAYALFSRRVRSCSSITHLTLDSVGRLSTQDAEIFTAMLSLDHPEEALFSIPLGLVEECDAILRERAPIQWKFDDAGRTLGDYRPFECVSPIKHVRTFSDDGQSEWVNALVPGYGRCQVKRSDLTFDCDSSAVCLGAEITSLSIRFTLDSEIVDGLPQLMAAVGSSLTSLSLDGPRELLGDALFLGCCPNLLELSLRGYMVETQLNFHEYQKSNNGLPSIICNWHDVVPLSTALMEAENPLTRCLRQLRVSLASPYLNGAIPHG